MRDWKQLSKWLENFQRSIPKGRRGVPLKAVQFPNGYSGKLLFHLTLNSLSRNFRIVLAKWQPFVYHLPKFSGNFGRNLKQLGKTILVCPTGTSQKSSPKFPNGISQWKNAVTISAFIYSNVMPSASIEPRKRLLNSVQFLKFPSNSGK